MNSRASRWRRPRRCPAYRVIGVLTMFSLSLGVLGTVGPTAAQSTNYPGSDYQMWRDDEIFVPLPSAGRLQSESYEYNPANNTLSAPLGYCQPEVSAGLQIAAAAGRIMSPYSDQVVVAYANASNNVEVHFADRCNLANPAVDTGPSALIGAASGMPPLAAWYDIAVGDLDKYPDPDFNYRDEVVVAYATPNGHLTDVNVVVAVLDYANSSTPTITSKTSGTIQRSLMPNWSGRDVPVVPLSVVTGDFDGDGKKEIAVAYVNSSSYLGFSLFRYTTTETDGVITHSLTPATPQEFAMGAPWSYPIRDYQGTIDAAAGDFDGNGKDELAVAAVIYGQPSSGADPRIAVELRTFRANSALTITQASYSYPYQDSSNGAEFVSGVQLAAGLFKYSPNSLDPTQNFNINRRQLALATNGSSGAVDLRMLVYDTNLTPTLATANAYQRIPPSGNPPGRLNFWMAAGGFNGLQTTDSPTSVVSSLAFTTWADNGQVLYLFETDPSTGKLGTPHFTTTLSAVANTSKSTSIAPLVAYDYGKLPTGVQTPGVLYGDSQYLGAPMYFRIDDIIMTDYILQEPPKHVYWKVGNFPLVPNCFDKAVCNISGQDAFTLGTIESQSLGMTSEYHDTFDQSYGVSETAGFAISKGVGIVPPKFSFALSETVGGEFTDHVDDYNTDRTTRTMSLEHMATRDDAISYRVQGLDVWRYPVYGVDLLDPDGNPMPYAYFDITAPAPDDETYLLGGIDASDWYQPLHENGNILSYPAPVGGANRSYDPADMGSFQVPCTDVSGDTCDHDANGNALSTMTITAPLLNAPTGFTWSGTGQTFTLIDSRSETQGHTHTWSKTLKNSEDLKVTGRIPLGVKPGGFKLNLNLDVAFNGAWSWGGAHTMEMKSDQVSTLKLNVPAGTSSESYNVYPSFYVSTDGTTKVGFAVDTDTVAGKSYWEAEYYAQPDPALNLPLRFNASTVNNATVWAPNTLDNRKLMRGFFVRRAEQQDGEYPQYDGPPVVGDQVRLEARVYNYSLGQNVDPPGGMKVRFDYAPIDPATHRVEEDKRTEIATTTIAPLGPRGSTTATINWDTSQLDLGGAPEQTYRVYVVLDPDDAVPNEKYETESAATRVYPIADCADPANLPPYCIDPGQNNEGWREVMVLADLAGDPRFGNPADVHLQADALAARDPSNASVMLTNTVQVEESQRLELRVKVDTDMLGAHYGHLLLYDGDPRKGGRLFADKQAFTGNPDGSYVWAEWTATEPGPHVLYAQLVESSVDTHTGNAIDDLEVVVHKATAPPTFKDDDGCTVTPTHGSRVAWWLLVPALVLAWVQRRKRG
jgi:hypothetical protein